MSDLHGSDHNSKSRHGRSKDQLVLDDMAVSDAHGRSEPYIIPERKSTKRSCAEDAESKTFKEEVDSLANDVYATYDAAVVAMKEECYEETAVKEFKVMASELYDHLKKTAKSFTSVKLSPDKLRKEIAGYAQIWSKEADRVNGNFRDSDEWGEEILLCVEASLTQVRRIEKAIRPLPEEQAAPLKKNLMGMLDELVVIANAPWEKLANEMEEEGDLRSERDSRSEKPTRSRVDVARSQISIDKRIEYREHLSRAKLDARAEDEGRSRTNTNTQNKTQVAASKSQTPVGSKSASQMKITENIPEVTEREEKIREVELEQSPDAERTQLPDEGKKVSRDEERKQTKDSERKRSREEEKRLVRDDEKRLSRDEEKKTPRDEEKRAVRDEEKRASRDEEKKEPVDDDMKERKGEKTDTGAIQTPDIDNNREEGSKNVLRGASNTGTNEDDVKRTPRDESKSRPRDSKSQTLASKSKTRVEAKKSQEEVPKKSPAVGSSKISVVRRQSKNRIDERKSAGNMNQSKSAIDGKKSTPGATKKESKNE